MKKYTMTHEIQAERIARVDVVNHVLELENGEKIHVGALYLRDSSPMEGGYYVQHLDGRPSFATAEKFEILAKEMKSAPEAESMERIARVCHEVNRAYCEALGDTSQVPWEEAPEWQRISARMGVDLHMAGDFSPEASHLSWMREKIETGWRYGPVKDVEKKEHPCLVSFKELPVEQQAKDYIFRAVVHALK